MSEKPVMNVADAGLTPIFPVIADGATVDIPVFPSATKLIVERRLTATGEVARTWK